MKHTEVWNFCQGLQQSLFFFVFLITTYYYANQYRLRKDISKHRLHKDRSISNININIVLLPVNTVILCGRKHFRVDINMFNKILPFFFMLFGVYLLSSLFLLQFILNAISKSKRGSEVGEVSRCFILNTNYSHRLMLKNQNIIYFSIITCGTEIYISDIFILISSHFEIR